MTMLNLVTETTPPVKCSFWIKWIIQMSPGIKRYAILRIACNNCSKWPFLRGHHNRVKTPKADQNPINSLRQLPQTSLCTRPLDNASVQSLKSLFVLG
uniref:Uncharacterized protein n=1 Tax=Pristionchus pacificus TaxID=54126 RepID=A0A2A6BWM1_PRIPA|eukprot:PDM70289.1 hypothetical protein PRIPAC_46535 [Pristionchus pacificus]